MNSQKIKSSILIFLSIFMISGCNNNNSNPINNNESPSTQIVNDTNYRAYTNKTYGFNLQIPKEWSVEEQGKYGIATFKNPLKDLVEGGPFGVNIVISAEDTQEAALASYVDFERKNLTNTDATYKITKDVPVKDNTAQLLEGIFQFQKWNLQQRVYITSKNGKFFILLATAPVETWNKYDSLFAKVLNSFE